jgi:hypothetical protein
VIKEKFIYADIRIRNILKANWLKQQNTNLINISLGGLGDEDKYVLQKILKRLDIFDLGVLLMNLAVGNLIEHINWSTYNCEHEYKCCCLYHCIQLFEKNNKFKLTNLISEQRFSQEFIDFLCYITGFSYSKKVSFKSLRNHHWLLTAAKDNVLVSLQELLSISRDYFNRKDYLHNKTNKRFQSFCESITLVLTCCDNYNKHFGINSSEHIFNEANEKNLLELSYEMGVDKDTLVTKLKPLYDNIFK